MLAVHLKIWVRTSLPRKALALPASLPRRTYAFRLIRRVGSVTLIAVRRSHLDRREGQPRPAEIGGGFPVEGDVVRAVWIEKERPVNLRVGVKVEARHGHGGRVKRVDEVRDGEDGGLDV